MVILVLNHTVRIHTWVKAICGLYPEVNVPTMLVAVNCHDCAKLCASSPNGWAENNAHLLIGKKKTRNFLTEELGKQAQVVQKVELIVGCHSISGQGKIGNPKLDNPTSTEEKIVHDGNALDHVDAWGLLYFVEKLGETIRKQLGIRKCLEDAWEHAVVAANGLILPPAKNIAGTKETKGLLRRTHRCFLHLASLNLKTIEDLRMAFREFLKIEDPELEPTLARFSQLGPDPKHPIKNISA